MRGAFLGLLGLVVASEAFAADYLRGSTYEGPSSSYDWSGVYFGGGAGHTNAEVSLGDSAGSIAGNLGRLSFLELSDAQSQAGEEGTQISRWLSLPRTGASGMSYGGFVGYNTQWGDAVMGVELGYNRTKLSVSATDSLGLMISRGGFDYPTYAFGGASAEITDYVTIKARAGYAAGFFMPYVAGGLVIGRANYAKFATIGYDQPIDPQPPQVPPRPVPGPFGPVSGAEEKNGVISVGYTVGAGVDIGLTPNLFVRGEWEYVQLGNFGGITASLNTFRAAAALKF